MNVYINKYIYIYIHRCVNKYTYVLTKKILLMEYPNLPLSTKCVRLMLGVLATMMQYTCGVIALKGYIRLPFFTVIIQATEPFLVLLCWYYIVYRNLSYAIWIHICIHNIRNVNLFLLEEDSNLYTHLVSSTTKTIS